MKKFALLTAAMALTAGGIAHAAETPGNGATAQTSDYTITLQDHKFSPAELVVPAGQKIKVTVKNANDKPAEFESATLNREKVVTPHSEITTYVGPLKAGSYTYFDDFDRATTGTITAK